MATEQPKDLSVRLKLSDANELLDELKEIVKGAESVDDAILQLIETIQAWASISGAAATAVQESFSRVASAIQAFGTDTKTVLDGVTEGLKEVGSTPIDIQLPEIDVDFTEQIQSQLEQLATSTSGLDNFEQRINTIIQTLQRLATETDQPFEQIAQRFLQTSERLGTLDSDTRTFVSDIVTNLQKISEVKLESSNIDEYKNSLNQLVISVQQLQFGEINTDPIADSLRNLADVSGQSLEQVKNDFIEAVGGLENLDANTQQIVSRVIENLGKIEQIKPTIGEIDTTAIADVQVKLQELVESATQLEKIKDKTTLVSIALQELSQQSGIPINELGNKFLQLVNQLDNLDTATRDSLNNIVSNIQKVGETELRIETGDQVQEQLNKLVESVSRLDTVDQKITAAVEGLKRIGAETGKPLQELGANFEQASQKADAFGNQIGQVTSRVIEEVRKFDNLDPSSPLEPVNVEQDAEEISEELDKLTQKIRDFFDTGFESGTFEQNVSQFTSAIGRLSTETGQSVEVVSNRFKKLGNELNIFGGKTEKSITQAKANLIDFREAGVPLGDVEERITSLGEKIKEFFGGEGFRSGALNEQIELIVNSIGKLSSETSIPLDLVKTKFIEVAEAEKVFGDQTSTTINQIVTDFNKLSGSTKSIDELDQKLIAFFEKGFGSENIEEQVKEAQEVIVQFSNETGKLIETVGARFLKLGDQAGAFAGKTRKAFREIINEQARLTTESQKTTLVPADAEQQLAFLEQERQVIDQLKISIRELATESEESFRRVGESIKNNLTPAQIRQLPAALRELNVEAQKSEGIFGNLSNKFSSLGNVGSFVFGSVLGVIATKALREIKKLIGESIQSFEEYISSIFRLEVAVRGLQRAGLDVTIRQYKDDVAALSEEFGIFSRKELADAQGRLTTFLRTFGFGFEEIQQSLRAALIISEVTGERLIDVVNRLQTAIGTGRFQGIRNLGINLDESVIRKLIETEKELGNITDEGTRAARSLAVLNEVTDQLADIAPDAARIQETLVGAARKSERAWEDLKLTLGDVFAPYVIALNNAKASTFEFLDSFFIKLDTSMDQLAALQAGRAAERQTRDFLEEGGLSEDDIKDAERRVEKVFEAVWSGFSPEQIATVKKQTREFLEGFSASGFSQEQIDEQAQIAFEKAFVAEARSRGLDDILGDLGGDLPGKTKSTISDVLGQWQQLWAKLTQEKEEFDAKMEDLEIRHSEKLFDIGIKRNQRIEDENTRFYRKIEDIGGEALRSFVESGGELSDLEFDISGEEIVLSLKNMEDEFILLGKIGGDALKDIQDAGDDLEDKIDEINAKLESSLASLARKLSDDIAKAGRQANDKRAGAEEKFRLNELKAERKFQENMRRLREEFIFDLEDALRERDARQVLRLTRRFRLDQGQLKRQADLDAQTRKDAFRLQLAEIQKQREIRIRELQIEAAARRRELIQQAKERRALLEAETKDRIAQILAEAQAEIDAEAGLHQQKLDDIELRQTRETEAENLANERRVAALQRNSADRLKVYEDELEAIIGIAGEVAEVRAEIEAQIEAIFNAIAGASFAARNTEQNRGVGYSPGQATGGTVFANQPTNILFGEGGAEMATFTPLTRPQSTRNIVRGTRDGRGGSDKVQVELLLSPDLQARVINKALQQSAEVFISEIEKR